MKKLMIMMFCLVTLSSQAQNFSEWFQQKKTQKKYLLQQIAALQIYIGYAKKGYKIAEKGLTNIGDLSGGELKLHRDYFNSLEKVNPEIRKMPKVAEILAMHENIVKDAQVSARQLAESNTFSASELEYMNGIFDRLLDDCEADVNELKMIVSDSTLEMKDDERITRIDNLWKEMIEKYNFSKFLGNSAKMLAWSRIHEQEEVDKSRVLQGIKK